MYIFIWGGQIHIVRETAKEKKILNDIFMKDLKTNMDSQNTDNIFSKNIRHILETLGR